MKYIFLLGFLLSIWAFSCPTFSYDGSERYEINGIISDPNGQPIEGIRIAVRGYDESYDSGLMQDTKTDINGRYKLIHSGSNATRFIMTINPQTHHEYYNTEPNSKYASKSIIYSRDRYQNYYLNLDDHGQLEESVTVDFICNFPDNTFRGIALNSTKGIVHIDSIIDFINPNFINFMCHRDKSINYPLFDTIYINNNGQADTILLGDNDIEYILK